jgi:cobalt-zinc-cadmium efflux system outer membrane protein
LSLWPWPQEETLVIRFRSRSPFRALPVALLAAGVLSAQQPAPSAAHRISLEEALRGLEASNPELRLAREELAAAEARELASGMFTNPGLSISREQLSGDGATYHESVVALGQTLELGGQRGARRRAAGEGVRAAEARLDAERLRLAFLVHRAYVTAAAAEANLAVLGEATEVFRRVETTGQARFAEGDISRFDRNRLQIERARYETQLARASLDLDAAARELALLVAPDSLGGASLLLPVEPLAGIAGIERALERDAALAAAAQRADVRAAAADVEAARASLSLAQRQRVPDLTVSGGYKHQADGFHGAVIGLSLPLPLWNRNQGEIAEAQAAVDAAVAREDIVRRRAESEIGRAWDVLRSLRERTRTLGATLLPESVGLLETARVSYAEGEMSLVALLDAADAYRSARETVNGLLASYLIATYDLERATGRLQNLQPLAATAR